VDLDGRRQPQIARSNLERGELWLLTVYLNYDIGGNQVINNS
jgi:hypothetical protein